MGKQNSPPVPDYGHIAQLQNFGNLANSYQQWQLSNPNTSGPFGSVSFSGAPTSQGGTGITQRTSLSPFEASRLGESNTLRSEMFPMLQNLQQQMAQWKPIGSGAEDINRNVVDSLYKQRTGYLDPQFQQQQGSMEAQLRAQGLAPGMKAYDDALANFGQERTHAYSDALSEAQRQGTSAGYAATQEDQMQQSGMRELFNQLAGYLSPQGPPQSGVQGAGGVPGLNLLGASQASFGDQLGNVNANNAQSSATMGTLAALAGAAMIACWIALAVYGPSDEFIFARLWILHGWKGRIANIVRAVYKRWGQQAAVVVSRSKKLQRIIRPLFDIAVAKGRRYASS